MMIRPWLIYLLVDKSGAPLYVGATCNLKRRLKEHSKRFGRNPSVEVLERGTGDGRAVAETRWIAFYRSSGVPLLNRTDITSEGRHSHTESTKRRLAEIFTGRKHSPETLLLMSQRLKGLKHNWSPAGRAAAAKTQYGAGYWEKLSDEQKRRHAASARQQWVDIQPEERSHLATQRNKDAWKRRTAHDRAAIGRNISAAQRRRFTPEELSARARSAALAGVAADPEYGAKCSSRVKAWWASLAPEAKAEQIARRVATRAAKRAEAAI